MLVDILLDSNSELMIIYLKKIAIPNKLATEKIKKGPQENKCLLKYIIINYFPHRENYFFIFEKQKTNKALILERITTINIMFL